VIYLYELVGGKDAGETIEIEHPLSQPALTEYKHNGRMRKVRRVIAGGTNFILKGDCWSRTNYSRGVQDKVSKEDRANLDKKP
jgi:predicted nucleic acid-binding Zn ribbon protein